jgi:AraC-like DNA-binding protein
MPEELPYPGVRMDGVIFQRAVLPDIFCARVDLEPFGLAYLLRRGSVVLEVEATPYSEALLEAGTIVSISGLIQHRFRSVHSKRRIPVSNLEMAPLFPAQNDAPIELIIGKVPNETLLTAGVYAGALIISKKEDPKVNLRIWKAFELIEDELANADTVGWTTDAVRQLSEIMLLNIMRSGIERAVQGRSNVRAMLDMRLLRVLMQIGRDPFRDWGVAEMGRVAGMSRTAFATHFHKVLKTTPAQLLTLLRLRAASAELASSVQSIEEVAHKSGYGSAAAFIRAFQRNFGTTPARWRTEHRR